MIKKEVKEKFGQKYYLLGKNKENQKVWLVEARFECGWYYALGYVQIFNRRYTDIDMHTHFNSLFLNSEKCCNDLVDDYFSETTFDKNEMWDLLELMQTAYTLRKYSDLLFHGGSYITDNILSDEIRDYDEYRRINEVLIPDTMNEVYKILGGEVNE